MTAFFCENCMSPHPPDADGNCRNCGSPMPAQEPEPPAGPSEEQLLAQAREGLRAIVQLLGSDPDAPELVETPERFLRVLLEYAGTPEDPQEPRESGQANLRWVLIERVAICPLHLQHYAVEVHVSWAPAVALHAGRATALAFSGLVSPGAAARRLADSVVAAGALGGRCTVRVARRCPGCDSGSEMIVATAGNVEALSPVRFG